MNILFISRGYPRKKYPQKGIFEYDQAKALSEYGYNIIFGFVDLRSIRRTRKWGFEKFRKDGITHYGINIPLGRFPHKILSFFCFIGLKLLYNKIINEYGKPNIIHAHFLNLGYSAAKLKTKNSIPLIITEHSSAFMADDIRKELINMVNYTYNKADKVIVVSPTLKRIIKERFNKDSIYIPNIVDTNIFKYNNKYNNPRKNFIFVSVGNLVKLKNMDITIKAFKKSFSNNKNIKLIIIGGGKEKANLKSLIRKNKLEEQVKLTGKIERKEIANYFKNSDCFVLASKYETFGVAFIEAMAVGLPVIATKCGGPEWFVNKNNGLLVEPNNVDELSLAMQKMYNNSDKYDRKRIATQIINCFSPNRVAEKISNVYKKFL